MTGFLVALLLTADPPAQVAARVPDLHAAQVCMAAAEMMQKTCAEIADGFVPVNARLEARRRCGQTFRRALELCLVENGIEVTEARRSYWRQLDELTDAAIACFNRVENDLRACVSRQQEDCRAIAEHALEQCRADRSDAERQLNAQLAKER